MYINFHSRLFVYSSEELYGAVPLAALISGGRGQADEWSSARGVEGPRAEEERGRRMMEKRKRISPSASSSRVTHRVHESDLWPPAIMLRAWRRRLIGGWTGRALAHLRQLSIKLMTMTNDCRDKERESVALFPSCSTASPWIGKKHPVGFVLKVNEIIMIKS